MSAKRRDNRNRILRNGESQRKDGRYMYKYIDNVGNAKYVYSWKLVKTDTVPQGAKNDISLRDKEKQIHKDLEDDIVSLGGGMTVLELVKKYISQKTGVRHNTEANYNFVINIIKKEAFGNKRIDKVKLSDAKGWLIKLQADGRGYSTIHTVRGVVRPAFQMAVDDDLIRKNPFEFQLATVVVNDSVTREAITRKQQRAFLEFVGLTISDIDLENGKINIDHQLQRKRNMEYIIEATKTDSGTRMVPMTEEVQECFRFIITNRKKPKKEPVIYDKNRVSYKGFLYLDKNDMPMVALHWEKYFQHICEKYNKIYKEELPKITPHVCRHTFCSNMAKSGMNPKTLQKIMGHSDIGVTLNTYTHLDFEDIQKEMKQVCDSEL